LEEGEGRHGQRCLSLDGKSLYGMREEGCRTGERLGGSGGGEVEVATWKRVAS
jgi:hypothetical protein